MALIKSVKGYTPRIGENCWFADNATIIGDVIIGNNCTVWFNTTVRGDVNSIIIGNNVNIQDGAVIHCTFEKSKTTIGDRVSIGHNAIVHGCHIADEVLIGMGAIIMDNAIIPSHCVLGAGTIVPENKKLEPGYIYVGAPARKLKAIEPEQLEFLIHRTARNYTKYASWFQ